MEANTSQKNSGSPQDITLPSVNNQLQYPFDYQTQRALDEYFNTRTSAAFPVGSIFISVVSTNPSTLLGYGTWSAFATGRTLVGIDAGQTEFDTVEETGGEKTHTLTITEIPAHTHTGNSVGGAGSGSFAWGTVAGNTALSTTGSTGGDGSHNNLQPYIVVYMWKRTA